MEIGRGAQYGSHIDEPFALSWEKVSDDELNGLVVSPSVPADMTGDAMKLLRRGLLGAHVEIDRL